MPPPAETDWLAGDTDSVKLGCGDVVVVVEVVVVVVVGTVVVVVVGTVVVVVVVGRVVVVVVVGTVVVVVVGSVVVVVVVGTVVVVVEVVVGGGGEGPAYAIVSISLPKKARSVRRSVHIGWGLPPGAVIPL